MPKKRYTFISLYRTRLFFTSIQQRSDSFEIDFHLWKVRSLFTETQSETKGRYQWVCPKSTCCWGSWLKINDSCLYTARGSGMNMSVLLEVRDKGIILYRQQLCTGTASFAQRPENKGWEQCPWRKKSIREGRRTSIVKVDQIAWYAVNNQNLYIVCTIISTRYKLAVSNM